MLKYFNLTFSYSSLITLLFYFFVKNALTVIRVRCLSLILFWVDVFKARSQIFIKIEYMSFFRFLPRRWLRRFRSLTRRRWRQRKLSTTSYHSPLSGISSWKRFRDIDIIWHFSSVSRFLLRTLIAWPSSLATLSDSTISQMTVQRLRQYCRLTWYAFKAAFYDWIKVIQ